MASGLLRWVCLHCPFFIQGWGYRCAAAPVAFTWVLRTCTQILMLVQQFPTHSNPPASVSRGSF